MIDIDALAHQVRPVPPAAVAAARAQVDALAKPPASLGRVEDLAVQLAGIAAASERELTPPTRSVLAVFAGDHGVVARGVTQWPSEVTVAMVAMIAGGRAASSVFAAQVGARVVVVDVGVAGQRTHHPAVIDRRVRAGTDDITMRPAMSLADARAAIGHGAEVAAALIAQGHDLLLVGDMGIGNTTPASALVAAFTGAAPADVVGPGAANDAATVARKAHVVASALQRHGTHRDPIATLAGVGGLEHAAIAGAILGAAAAGVPVLLDGISTNAAALVAAAVCPASREYMVAAHRSREPAAAVALAHLGREPLMDLEMALGEGTGALLAVPVVRAAAALVGGMARLDEVS